MGFNSAPGNGQKEDNDKLAKEAMETLQKFPEINRTELYDKVVRHYLKTSWPQHFPDIEENKNEEPNIDTIPFEDHMKIFKLVHSPNTPRETLDLLLNEMNRLYHNEHQIDSTDYGYNLRAIALNPKTDPKTIEENIENILRYSYNRFQRGDIEHINIFLTRPDLTPETIRKIAKSITIEYAGYLLSMLIYNPNMPRDLLETLLKNKVVRESIHNYPGSGEHIKEFFITGRYPELLKDNKE